jgi:tetratricopeptide (TPR) repeat protein
MTLEVAEALSLALEHQQAGRLEQAEALYREILAREPDNADALDLLGVLACQKGRRHQAAALIARAVTLNPAASFYHNNLGNVLQELGRFEDSVLCYQQALRLEPEYAEALSNLGNALTRLGRTEEALACLIEALRLKPDDPGLYSNLGATLQTMGRVDEAVACHQEALRLDPECVHAHTNLAAACLLAGDFRSGWREHEWRWKAPHSPARRFRQPQWDGAPLSGRSIFLYAEQGLGDTIQYARYAPIVRRRGASRVILECQARLVPLLQSLPDIDCLVPAGAPLPRFDVQAPLLSLPWILGTTLDTIPAQVPYLQAEAARVQSWGRRTAALGSLKAGLVWSGNPDHKDDRNRSIPLELFVPLAGVAGVEFFSLQKGPAAAQLSAAPALLRITNLEEESNQITDTAAIMMNLDWVITVDTMAAHLAGALGRPVWILLPFAPDCRWLLGRQDSPWYPSARLFRQHRPGDWRTVIEQVKEALETQCHGLDKR